MKNNIVQRMMTTHTPNQYYYRWEYCSKSKEKLPKTNIMSSQVICSLVLKGYSLITMDKRFPNSEALHCDEASALLYSSRHLLSGPELANSF